MHHYALRLFLVAGVALVTLGVNNIPAEAAAPRLVMVDGGSLTQPIILDDWDELMTLMSAATEAADVRPEDLAKRPYLRIAFFWGPEWTQYVNAGKPLTALRPDQGNQHGRFYPAMDSAAPVLTFDSIPGPGALIRRLQPEGVAVLTRHGIPTRYQVSASAPVNSQGKSPIATGLLLVGLVFAGGVLIAAIRFRSRSLHAS